MKVKRIVANIASPEIAAAKRFYQDALGLLRRATERPPYQRANWLI
jgi:hypothetical protein